MWRVDRFISMYSSLCWPLHSFNYTGVLLSHIVSFHSLLLLLETPFLSRFIRYRKPNQIYSRLQTPMFILKVYSLANRRSLFLGSYESCNNDICQSTKLIVNLQNVVPEIISSVSARNKLVIFLQFSFGLKQLPTFNKSNKVLDFHISLEHVHNQWVNGSYLQLYIWFWRYLTRGLIWHFLKVHKALNLF